MKKAILFLLILMPLQTSAREIAGITLPERLETGKETLILNGAGIREKFYFDIYAVGLYLKKPCKNADKILKADETMAIRMHMVSDLVTPERMSSNVNEGFVRSTGGKTGPIKERKDRMISVFKDGIKDNDIYDLIYKPGSGVSIYKNGKLFQTIPGLDFKKALYGIWIAEPPLSDDLKKGLLGG